MSKKIVIIGGVAGGASTAARLRRQDETAEIILLERGEYISYANCGLPYHVGDVIQDRDALLLQTPEKMKGRFNVDVRTGNEVTAIVARLGLQQARYSLDEMLVAFRQRSSLGMPFGGNCRPCCVKCHTLAMPRIHGRAHQADHEQGRH